MVERQRRKEVEEGFWKGNSPMVSLSTEGQITCLTVRTKIAKYFHMGINNPWDADTSPEAKVQMHIGRNKELFLLLLPLKILDIFLIF